MQLAILLAVVCALAHGESAAGPVGGVPWRTALVLMGTIVAPLAAAIGSRRLVRGLAEADSVSAADCERTWTRIEGVTLALWLAVVAATMYLLAWPRVVRSDFGLGGWPLVDELVILLPVVVPLLLLWTVMAQLQWSFQASQAHALGDEAPRYQPWRFVGQCARQHLGLILLPALAVIGAHELVVKFWPAASDGRTALWLFGPLLLAMLVGLPLLLKRIWRTSPLPAGELRETLIGICSEQRVGVRDILVWHTGGQMANAAVAGIVRGCRYVFLTDGLLTRLSSDEVEAVLRHEVGHLTGRHMLLRMLMLTLPLAVWMAATSVVPGLGERLETGLAGLGIPEAIQTSLVLPAVLAAYAILAVGRYSKWLEHEADLAAATNADGSIDRSAAESLARALVKIVGRGPSSRLREWLHPPITERLAVLALAVADPNAAIRFRSRLSRVAWAMGTIYAGAAIALLVAGG
jgi:Zn-dependent protease with chaperone function